MTTFWIDAPKIAMRAIASSSPRIDDNCRCRRRQYEAV